MNLDERVAWATTRSLAYKHLSTCYYLPEQATLDVLGELEEAVAIVCPEAAADVAAMRQNADLEQLKVDFSRLFVGPFKLIAPPYGSVYLEGQRAVMGASTVDAEKHYREAGLDMAGSLNDAPDHVAIELEFLYYLIFEQIEALKNTDSQAADAWMQKQQDFLHRHLGAWIVAFSEAAEQGAKTDFYKHLAIATRRFVLDDKAMLDGRANGSSQANGSA